MRILSEHTIAGVYEPIDPCLRQLQILTFVNESLYRWTFFRAVEPDARSVSVRPNPTEHVLGFWAKTQIEQ